MEELQRIATEVRKYKRSLTRIGPTGLCFDWNLALAAVLALQYDGVRFKRGKFRTDTNGDWPHYWAEAEGYLLDITPSQYNVWLNERVPQVVVAKLPFVRYIAETDETNRLIGYDVARQLREIILGEGATAT